MPARGAAATPSAAAPRASALRGTTLSARLSSLGVAVSANTSTPSTRSAFTGSAVGRLSTGVGALSTSTATAAGRLGTRAGSNSRISNVAPGTQGRDAVDINPLQASEAATLARSESYAAGTIAQVSALARAPSFGPRGNSLTAGFGSFAGYGALGLQYAHTIRAAGGSKGFVSFGLAASDGGAPVLLHAGVSIDW